MTVTVKQSAVATGPAPRDDSTSDAAAMAVAPMASDTRCIVDSPRELETGLTATVVPSPIAARLAVAWPHIERYLRRALRARGLSRDDTNDVLQQVALHALERGPDERGTDEDLLRWAYVVAMNEDTDRRRRAHRWAALEATAGPQGNLLDCHVVESAVEARLAVEAVWGELARLPLRDREAVLDALGTDAPRADVNPRTEAVRRFRGRARLHAAVRRAVGGLAPIADLRRRIRTGTAATSLAACALAPFTFGMVKDSITADRLRPPPPEATGATSNGPSTPARAFVTPLKPTGPSGSRDASLTATATTRSSRQDEEPQRASLASVRGPNGTRADVDRSPDPGDRRLVCLKNLPEHGDEYCVYQPAPVTLPGPTLRVPPSSRGRPVAPTGEG